MRHGKYHRRLDRICSAHDVATYLAQSNSGSSPKGVGKQDYGDSLFPRSMQDSLNLALKVCLSSFSYGVTHEDGSVGRACAQDALLALHPKSIPKSIVRGFLGDLLKVRIQMRKALQLQRKRKEIFEMARKSLEITNPEQTASSECIKTPWQQLLHKGAPGSKLTTVLANHENAQLVPHPLLRLIYRMTEEWKNAHRDILKLVRFWCSSPSVLH